MRQTTNHEYMQMFGDSITGEYTDAGGVLKEAIITNPEQRDKLAKAFAMSAAMGGGTLLPGNDNKPVKKIKATPKRKVKANNKDVPPLTPALTQLEVDMEPPHMPPKRTHTTGFLQTGDTKRFVYLHNQMGKIKMSVLDVLESSMGYCLVFANDDDLIFTPNVAETLNFTSIDGNTTPVYYADTLFTWLDDTKKLMILIKADTNE